MRHSYADILSPRPSINRRIKIYAIISFCSYRFNRKEGLVNTPKNIPADDQFFQKLLLVLLVAIVFAAVLNHYEAVLRGLAFIGNVLYPIFVGIAFAFVLNIPQKSIERVLARRKRFASHRRGLSIALSLVGVVFILYLFASAFIPQFIQTMRSLAAALPNSLAQAAAALAQIPSLQEYAVRLQTVDWDEVMRRGQEFLVGGRTDAFYTAVHTTAEFAARIVQTFVGVILGVYFLHAKEMLTRQIKRLLYAAGEKKTVDLLIHIGAVFNQKFYSFVCGQMLDSFIFMMGLFAFMVLFGLPHAAMISAIVVFTGLIPLVGGVIGGGIGAVFIFVESPAQALIFLAILIVLHQIDSNFIYPKIMGKSLGLPEVWSFVAIIVGGGMFGVLGMLLGVPVFSAVYTLLAEFVRHRLKERDAAP
ncbi:hypothetical protein HMPREF9161_01282 [Selenomonas sp. F0473]|nr:hypothetical protein HMPREF9161_01282 [Selenomonas sp. F0473]